MRKWKCVMAIPGDSFYLNEQVLAAQAAAERLGMELSIVNAEMDPVTQSQQLLSFVQSPAGSRPDAILLEPVNSSGLQRVAEAAVAVGIAWIVSNARVDYLGALRGKTKVPVLLVSQDHVEIGRIQGRQIGALLPEGGSILYLRGPVMSSVATQRFEGLDAARPKNVDVKVLKVQGATAEDAREAVCSWLALSMVRPEATNLIASQNADFIVGARKAFETNSSEPQRSKWLSLPCMGVGIPKQIKPLVDQGTLCAAVLTALTANHALEMVVQALKTGTQPPEQTFVEASAYPSIEELTKRQRARAQGHPTRV